MYDNTMTYYLLGESDLVSIQLLLVLNLANIFIMLLIFFLFIDKNQNNNLRITPHIHIIDNEIVGTYQVRFDDLIGEVFSDDFPYGEKCSICLEDFESSDDKTVIKTENCNHYYHEVCIKQWLRIRTTCPNCQNNLVARHIES